MPAVTEVEDEIIMDEDDYGDDVEIVMPGPWPESKTTDTKNFMGEEPVIVDEIEDLGVVVVDPEADNYIVRVIADVGPVYYGSEQIEMKRGHRYRVPPHIYQYLKSRDMLWEHQ